MKEERIKIVYVKYKAEPRVIDIDNNLDSMQALVGGNIEEIMPYRDEVALVCNEEGKLLALPLNRAVFDDIGNLIDIIAGDFFICYAPYKSEYYKSLPSSFIDKYTEMFALNH